MPTSSSQVPIASPTHALASSSHPPHTTTRRDDSDDDIEPEYSPDTLATPDYTPESPDYTPESPDYTPESPSLPHRDLPSDVDYRDSIIRIGESSGARSVDGTPSADPVFVVHPDASIGIAVPVSAPASASASAPSAVGQSGIIDITDDLEEDPQEVEVYPEGTDE
ncbi:hypothetical protein GUJ93_ZPchr0010g10855 [Zizania palustris]|uniref:Uncharacterized protein n=1 Tax=Zizania palustris TaxID=103762 RepID=A0A8J5WGG2_ZIZPA|nr:hypothetical protein GUJ93_ZPchr0010g10855 [Zizania palustris]